MLIFALLFGCGQNTVGRELFWAQKKYIYRYIAGLILVVEDYGVLGIKN